MTMLFGPGLLAAPTAAHKRQRKTLNPLFTGPQIRKFTGIFYDIGHKVSTRLSLTIDKEDPFRHSYPPKYRL